VIGGFDDEADVGVKGEGGVKDYANFWGLVETMVPLIVSEGGFVSLLRVDLEPMRRSSVLLLLRWRKFFCIKSLSSDR
jgi:hypothetical protein